MGAAPQRRQAERYVLTEEDYRSVSLVRLNGERELLDAELLNLSASGALIQLKSRIEADVEDPFLFEFKVPTTEDVIVWKARVARVEWRPHQFRLGLQFLDLPEALQASLAFGLEIKLAEQRIESIFNKVDRLFRSRWFRDFMIALIFGALLSASVIYVMQNRGASTNKFEFFRTLKPVR